MAVWDVAIVADRNRPLKHVQRARIVLCSADRLSVQEVARRASVSRPAVWPWQARYPERGVEGLLRDKTRKPGRAPLSAKVVAKVMDLTCSEPRATPRIGPAAPGPRPSASACAPCSTCGTRIGCSRTAFALSSAPTNPSPPRKSRTSSVLGKTLLPGERVGTNVHDSSLRDSGR
jgi:hypothetical protein